MSRMSNDCLFKPGFASQSSLRLCQSQAVTSEPEASWEGREVRVPKHHHPPDFIGQESEVRDGKGSFRTPVQEPKRSILIGRRGRQPCFNDKTVQKSLLKIKLFIGVVRGGWWRQRESSNSPVLVTSTYLSMSFLCSALSYWGQPLTTFPKLPSPPASE